MGLDNNDASRIKFHLTVDEQIALLKHRGMSVSDDTEGKDFLSRFGYYRLSGYFYPLRKTNPVGTVGRQDTFQENTSLEIVVQLYEFDRKLRLLILDAVERIEVAVRSDIAHRLGQRHRVAHEMPSELDRNFCTKVSEFNGKTAHQEWCERLETVLRKAHKEDFVKHHTKHYGGKLPIWVVVEVWNFGLLSKFFAGMKYKDQTYIAQKYGLPEAKYLVSWLRAVNFARNVSAHHSRLWNRNFPDRPTFPPAQPHHHLHHVSSDNVAQTRVYGTLCVLKTMLNKISPNDGWSERLHATCNQFPVTDLFSLASAGFPDNWASKGLWA